MFIVIQNLFAEIDYYRSILDNKTKIIIAMKKANENLVQLNFTPVDEQYKQLFDTFDVCILQNILFLFINFFLIVSKFVNKHPIGKKNLVNILDYGKIFINI